VAVVSIEVVLQEVLEVPCHKE
jgi:hypothetical protein